MVDARQLEAEEKSLRVKKVEYSESIKEHKKKIEDITSSIKTIEKEVLKNSELSSYGRLSMANSYINIIGIFCTMSDISLQLLGVKNEGFLNEGRKLLYKVFSVLEDVVGDFVDAPLNENDEKLATISKLDDMKKLNLYKKILDSLKSIEDRFGPNSKWKWSFVDLEGECAIVLKNMADFRRIQAQRDPRHPGYVERNEILRLVKENLRKGADRYREKYEMTTHEPTEMKKAVLFLAALQRIHLLFNEPTESEAVKKNIQIWQEKIDSDLKKAEEDRKKNSFKK